MKYYETDYLKIESTPYYVKIAERGYGRKMWERKYRVKMSKNMKKVINMLLHKEYVDIGNKCREFRKNSLKMTQEEVAFEAAVSPSTVSNFESGKHGSFEVLAFYVLKGFKYEKYVLAD